MPISKKIFRFERSEIVNVEKWLQKRWAIKDKDLGSFSNNNNFFEKEFSLKSSSQSLLDFVLKIAGFVIWSCVCALHYYYLLYFLPLLLLSIIHTIYVMQNKISFSHFILEKCL